MNTDPELIEMLREWWPTLLGLFVAYVLGFFTCAIFAARNYHRGFRCGCRQTDRLWTARIAQDRRDDTPLPQPVTR